MKGGITSGVVYPLAACELAKAFRFRNIGGTSAGAIAAAATAAAELGRQRGVDAFELLEQLPDFLGQKPPGRSDSNLFYFFQPQPATKPIFDVCVSALGAGKAAPLRVLGAAARAFPLWLLLGLVPGALFIWWSVHAGSGLFLCACIALGLAMALVLGLVALAWAFLTEATSAIPANFFGLCSGMAPWPGRSSVPGPSDAVPAAGQALTPWLTQYLNQLAGKPIDGPPLTFGELWNAQDSSSERNINLEMMTTSLSHGRPYRLPFRDDEFVREDGLFYFRSDEFRLLFPEPVVLWMEQNPRRPKNDASRQRAEEYLKQGYRPMPEPWNLPVVVAVRMSLSFPVLLSAVPLHAIDFSRKDPADQVLERCWFSDGGISSNFPVHFFDSLLPRWPTFGITLTDKHPDYPAMTYLPTTNASGAERWTRFDRDPLHPRRQIPGLAQLGGFLSSILNAMQNWADNTQARLPGYRDRIAIVSLTDEEGGLNLNMPHCRIDKLAGRGQEAGTEFAKRFATPHPDCVLDWRNHRWVRLRSALGALEEDLVKLDRSCAQPLSADQPYDVWAATADNDSLPSYRWESCAPGADWKAQRALAAQTLEALRQCAQALEKISAPAGALATGAPRPRPELRVRPRI